MLTAPDEDPRFSPCILLKVLELVRTVFFLRFNDLFKPENWKTYLRKTRKLLLLSKHLCNVILLLRYCEYVPHCDVAHPHCLLALVADHFVSHTWY